MRKEEIIQAIYEKPDVVYQRSFFDSIKSTSLLQFRRNINLVQDLRPTFYLEQKVDSYYEELLKQYDDETGLFFEYQNLLKIFQTSNHEALKNYKHYHYLVNRKMIIQLEDYLLYQDGEKLAYDYFVKNTREKISEIVVDGLFRDTIYNVWINIREMIRYHNGLEQREKFLNQDRLNFYQKILEIDSMSNVDKIQLYHELKNKNIALLFYQDWYKVRKHSYQKMKNSLFRVKEKGNLFCYQKSLQNQVPIYELNGDDFFMLVSCRKRYTESDSARRHCYTLISSYNMEVFSKRNFIYGYSDFSLDEVMHIFEHDIASSSNFGSNSFTTSFVNRIMTPEQISYSKGYSEIQMVNKRKENDSEHFLIRKPNYLVVFDEIEERHLIEAKRLHIPIVVIPTSKYLDKIRKNSKSQDELGFDKFDMILDTYTNGCEMEKDKKSRR